MNEERQRLLEIDYALSQIKVIKYTKLATKRFIGRFYKKKYQQALDSMNDIFRELRTVTKGNYPERFIQSE